MSVPGFTAEASLYKINGDNQSVFIEAIDSMQILPQSTYYPLYPLPIHKCFWVCDEYESDCIQICDPPDISYPPYPDW
jgi:hypothetical protein